MSFLRRPIVPVGIFLLVSIDQFTKYLVQTRLAVGQVGFLLKGGLGIKYVLNPDVSFVLFSFKHPHAAVIKIGIMGFALVLVAIVFSFFAFRFGGERLMRTAFVFECSALLGNIVDLIFLRYVRDFLVLPKWPIFNVADVFGVVATILFFSGLLLNPAARAQFSPRTPKSDQVALRDILIFVRDQAMALKPRTRR